MGSIGGWKFNPFRPAHPDPDLELALFELALGQKPWLYPGSYPCYAKHLNPMSTADFPSGDSSPSSNELAHYIEATNGITKPWLLTQLRLKKLQERRSSLSSEAYEQELADLHQDLMNLGEWWVGQEDQVF